MCDPSPSNPKRKRSLIIHRQAREMAVRVLQMCIEERKDYKICLSINKALDRAVRYTGLAKRTLSTIQKEAKKGTLRTPSKKGKTCDKNTNLNVDDIDRSLIHRCIEDFYLSKKVVPTCPKLLVAIREEMQFPWGLTSLRKSLKVMGYQWQKCHNKRRILVERPAIVFARSNYLQKIRQYRQDDRNIFFLDETWIDSSLTFKKCWRNELVDSVLTNTSTNRLILIHAGSRTGFIHGAKWLFHTTGDYHRQLNSANFEKWCTEMLIPNLPENSVVVMDNASYHSVQKNKVPTKSSTRSVMLDWLIKNNITASVHMRKAELYRLIKLHKPVDKLYKIDQLIRSHGHDVLRLPQYMCDLNPMELVWMNIIRILRGYNVHSDLSLNRLEELTELAIKEISDEDWRGFDDYVIRLEENYWKRDGEMEEAIDRFILEVSDGEDSDSDSGMSVIFESDSE